MKNLNKSAMKEEKIVIGKIKQYNFPSQNLCGK